MFNPNQLYMPVRSLAPIAKKSINWAGILTNTQKTLNIVNQAIPVVYQIKPMISNARTMFRVASEFTKSNSKNNITNNQNYDSNNSNSSNNYNNTSYSDNVVNFDCFIFAGCHATHDRKTRSQQTSWALLCP